MRTFRRHIRPAVLLLSKPDQWVTNTGPAQVLLIADSESAADKYRSDPPTNSPRSIPVTSHFGNPNQTEFGWAKILP